MAGHSKWSKIKRAKGAADKKRGKIFTRCIHEITTAVREGGSGDPGANPRLRLAIDKAKSQNMPGDTIDRAIKRATGEGKDVQMAEITYEGYGPGGAAVLVETLTDNKNRTVGEVRHAFSKCGGSLGENGCVNWMFTKQGVIAIPKKEAGEEQVMEQALEAGAEDVNDEEDVWEVLCDPVKFDDVKSKLAASFAIEEAEVMMIAASRVSLSGKEAEQMLRLLEMLEDLDDVQNVSANCDFEEEVAA